MSAPDDVTLYYIYKAGLRVGDDNLAITFQGVDQPVTVEKLVFNSTQIWMVEYSEFVPGVQAILPISDLTLQATWGDNDSVNVSWSIESYWIIEKADNGYIILNDDRTAEWGVTKGLAGEKVTIMGLYGATPNKQWIFQKM